MINAKSFPPTRWPVTSTLTSRIVYWPDAETVPFSVPFRASKGSTSPTCSPSCRSSRASRDAAPRGARSRAATATPRGGRHAQRLSAGARGNRADKIESTEPFAPLAAPRATIASRPSSFEIVASYLATGEPAQP
jgi:hypothetical protein